jgi:hypothetical protein
MSKDQSSRSLTGADFLGIEVDRETKAMIMARLRERQAALQLELANIASKICRTIETRLDAIEKELDQ